MTLKRFLEAWWYVLLGPFVFWTPDVLLHWLRGQYTSGWDVLILTLLLPSVTCLVLVLLWTRSRERRSHKAEALAALAGIWVFGPAMMSLEWTFGGAHSHGLRFLLVCTVLFPICTFVMSTSDGTLGALIITTALLVVLRPLRLSRGGRENPPPGSPAGSAGMGERQANQGS